MTLRCPGEKEPLAPVFGAPLPTMTSELKLVSNFAIWQGGLDESADILQILKDCFARKATATVLKRTYALWDLAD